jgi:DNA ligase 1
MTSSPPLYKLDSKGKIRVWFMEQDWDKYRTFDGIHGGNVKSSSWRTAKPTNVGRSNARDGVAQAAFEIESQYAKKLKGAYYEDIDDVHQTEFQPGFGQPKLDGQRAVAKVHLLASTVPSLWSREGELVAGGDHIMEALEPLFAADLSLIFDGEIYNHEFKDRFGELMSMAKKGNPSPERAKQIREGVQYHIYDLPSHPGTFSERFSALEGLLAQINHPSIYLVDTLRIDTVGEFDQLHGTCISAGYEGSMLRRDDIYVNDRTDALLKRKDFDDAEFDIVRIEAGEGNWAGAAKRVICWLPSADQSQEPDDTNTFGAGLRGDYPTNQALLADAANQKVVTINFFGWTDTAIPKPRFGVATKFHGTARVD